MQVRADTQELRLALVLTGGVSLSVWMGGAAAEIQALATRRGVYGRLADLTRTRPVVDVVGGTSAGGVNGALLALSLAHSTDMTVTRDLWVERGDLSDLLRDDTEMGHDSLLRGDGYHLPQLRHAFDVLRGTPVDPDEQPMELIITGTLYAGASRTFADSFGSSFTDTVHRAEFRFRRSGESDRDDFADERIAAKLALVARSTSAFPGAFEPSFCPVGEDGDDLHPDLAGHASFTSSSLVIDGGVLVNKPLRPVLDTVLRHADPAHIRRVIAYIEPAPEAASTATAAPGMSEVLRAGLLGIPHAESLAVELGAIADHNERHVRQSRLRRSLLGNGAAWLEQFAERLLSSYAADIADARVAEIAEHLPVDVAHRVEVVADTARNVLGLDSAPTRLPRTAADVATWPWTDEEVREADRVLSDLVFRTAELPAARALTQARRQLDEVEADLLSLRHEAHRVRRQSVALDRAIARGVIASTAPVVGPDALAAVRSELGRLHGSIAALTARAIPLMRSLAEAASRSRSAEVRAAAAQIDRDLPTFTGSGSARVLATQRWLLGLAVAVVTTGSGEPTAGSPIEFLHISGEAPNAVDDRRHPAQKLAGLQLAHFGAFYKSTWRANDWMWGRLDASTRLVQLMLAPARLRELAIEDPTFARRCHETIRSLAGGDTYDDDGVATELAIIADPSQPCPEALPRCVQAVARRLQLDVLRQELPFIATRVDADAAAGHAVPDQSAAARAAVPADASALTDEAVVEAFRACQIGEERLAHHSHSPAYQRLVDRVTTLSLGMRASHERRQHVGRGVLRRPSAPFARAVHQAALSSHLLLVAIGVLLLGGDALLFSTLSSRMAGVVATVIGVGLLALAVALLGLRVRRPTRVSAALASASVAGGVALSFVGPVAWRLWLCAVAAVGLLGSTMRARRGQPPTAMPRPAAAHLPRRRPVLEASGPVGHTSTARISGGRLVLLIAAVAGLSAAFVASYVGGLHEPKPHRVPVAVVAPADRVALLASALGPVAADVRLIPSASGSAARSMVEHGSADGAYIPGRGAATLVTASGTGPASVQLLTGIFTKVAAATGQAFTVQDVAPLSPGDQHDLVAFYLVIGWIVGSYLLATILGLYRGMDASGVPDALRRLGLFVGFGLVTAVAGVGIVEHGYGYVHGHGALLVAIGTLVVVATAAATTALESVAGIAGTATAILLFVVLGNPSAGGPWPSDMLPAPWRDIGPWLPNGAAVTAVRRALYFHGNGIARPAAVLLLWAAAGSVVTVLMSRRGRPLFDIAGRELDVIDLTQHERSLGSASAPVPAQRTTSPVVVAMRAAADEPE